MFEVGRVCVKIAGRDAGKRCVIVDLIDKNFVMVDGETRRRKCNIRHLEATRTVVDLAKGAENKDVAAAMKSSGIEVAEKKLAVAAEKTAKPKRVRVAKRTSKKTNIKKASK
jgi:large subunit ribosomal protein L14e